MSRGRKTNQQNRAKPNYETAVIDTSAILIGFKRLEILSGAMSATKDNYIKEVRTQIITSELDKEILTNKYLVLHQVAQECDFAYSGFRRGIKVMDIASTRIIAYSSPALIVAVECLRGRMDAHKQRTDYAKLRFEKSVATGNVRCDTLFSHLEYGRFEDTLTSLYDQISAGFDLRLAKRFYASAVREDF